MASHPQDPRDGYGEAEEVQIIDLNALAVIDIGPTEYTIPKFQELIRQRTAQGKPNLKEVDFGAEALTNEHDIEYLRNDIAQIERYLKDFGNRLLDPKVVKCFERFLAKRKQNLQDLLERPDDQTEVLRPQRRPAAQAKPDGGVRGWLKRTLGRN